MNFFVINVVLYVIFVEEFLFIEVYQEFGQEDGVQDVGVQDVGVQGVGLNGV